MNKMLPSILYVCKGIHLSTVHFSAESLPLFNFDMRQLERL